MARLTMKGGGRRSVLALPSNLGDIKDPELQRLLTPLYHAWNVRNGYVGNGEEKFLTKVDLEELIRKDRRIGDALGSLVASEVSKGVDQIRETGGDQIKEISSTIFNDPLWISLGENIERLSVDIRGVDIKVQNEESARIEGDNAIYEKYDLIIFGSTDNNGQGPVGGILQELTGLANDYAVLAEITNKVQATLGGYLPTDGQDISEIVTVEEQMRAFGDFDEHLAGEYTVKIDHSGYVSGFGLASYPSQPGDPCDGLSSDNGPRPDPVCSRFYVRADVFAVGHPDENAYPVMPFIVKNGKVYIDAAVISDASIDTAKIDWLYANQIVGGLNRIRPISVNNPGWRVPPRNADGTVNYSRVFTTEIRPEYLPSDLPDGVPADATAYIPCATVSMEVTTKGGGSHEDSFYLFIRLVNSRTGRWSQSPVVTAFTKEAGSATVTHALSEKRTDVFYLEVWVGNHHKEGEVTALTGMTMAIR